MNKICELLDIQYPVVQAGMIWCSGWKLASAVSNAGGLGLIGSGSMYPAVLQEHIQKCKAATAKPFGVNVPMLYPQIEDHLQIICDEKVPIVFTSAGNPKKYTGYLKEKGIKVVHVVSSARFAQKAEAAGVDALVAEGFEAGGHNGREETTTFCLLPQVAEKISVPLIAAGGIATGRQMLAAMVLGADGVQIGSRFVATPESSGHAAFKEAVLKAEEGATVLTLKELAPVRLLQNDFYRKVQEAYAGGADAEKLKELLGRGRAKKGMFEGNLTEGELEIGQVSGLIKELKPAADVLREIVEEYEQLKAQFH